MRFTRFLIAFTLALLFLPSVAFAQSTITLNVQAGFDAYYREDSWTPVRVSLSNGGNEVNGQVRIIALRSNGSKQEYVYPVSLASGARKEITMHINVAGFANRLQVEYVQDKNVLASATPRLTQLATDDLLYGVIASNTSAFNFLGRVDPMNGRGHIAQLTIQDLPTAAQDWHALNVLVFSDVDTSLLTPAQKDAMKVWLTSGGRLIVTSGPSWQKLAGLEDLLPMKISGTRNSTITSLESFAVKRPPSSSTILAAGDLKPNATLLVAEGGVPLVVEQTTGYGRIDLLTFDPALDPLRTWDGMENLYRNLLALTSERPGWMNFVRNWTSAAEAINSIPGIGLPHPLLICGFLAVYLIFVGPINYLVLRVIKRRELAWLTIPATVILFTIVIYVMGFSIRGTRPTVHRLTIVQAWEDSSRAQAESIIGIFSPSRAEYDLRIEGDMLIQTLPADSYLRPNDTAYSAIQMEEGDAMLVRGLKVDVGAVTPFLARGQVAAPRFNSALKFSVAGNYTTLEGTIVNRSDLTLHDAVVITAGGIQQVGEVKPNGTVNVKTELSDQAIGIARDPNRVFPVGYNKKPQQVFGAKYSNYDRTIEDILGKTSFTDSRETYRRYSILSWLFAYDGGGRGSGTYLIGWTDKSPIEATLTNSGFVTQDQTLYIVRVEPQVAVTASTITLPPNLMTWEFTELSSSSSGALSPYDISLNNGYLAFQFKPVVNLKYKSVSSLVMHLTSYGSLSGAPPLTLSLLDQTEQQWVKIDNFVWGDTTIQNASRFVSNDGGIDVKVENTNGQSVVNIQALDFTLTVQR